MKKIKSISKSFISFMIVFMGAYLISFYLRNDISIISSLCGCLGFWFLAPAVTEWEKILWGEDANSKQVYAKKPLIQEFFCTIFRYIIKKSNHDNRRNFSHYGPCFNICLRFVQLSYIQRTKEIRDYLSFCDIYSKINLKQFLL